MAVSRSSSSRLGITVTTKIDKRAARRNTLKRRVRELFRRGLSLENQDMVIIALTGATLLTYVQINEELTSLVEKASRFLARRASS